MAIFFEYIASLANLMAKLRTALIELLSSFPAGSQHWAMP